MVKLQNIFFTLLMPLPSNASLPTVKSTCLVLAFALLALPALAEDWVTTDGTKYQNVRVIRVEDDAITIIYKDGGALVPLFKLPPALQQKFDYDPVKAKLAAEARAKADKENAEELQREIEQSAVVKHQQQVENARQLGYTNTAAH